MTGDAISAPRAFQLGLVNAVVPAGQLHAEAERLARRLIANAPLSVRAAKATVYAATERHRADAFEEAERIWAPVYRSRDAQEGPQAFREKRAPNWLGR